MSQQLSCYISRKRLIWIYNQSQNKAGCTLLNSLQVDNIFYEVRMPEYVRTCALSFMVSSKLQHGGILAISKGNTSKTKQIMYPTFTCRKSVQQKMCRAKVAYLLRTYIATALLYVCVFSSHTYMHLNNSIESSHDYMQLIGKIN